jgi:hypothetical protein
MRLIGSYSLVTLAICALLSPGAPLVIAWARSSGRPATGQLVPLAAITFSFIWLVAIGWRPIVVATFGGYYVRRPLSVIGANLLVVLLCAVLAVTRSSWLSMPTGIACAMVAVLWMAIS